MPKFVDGWKLRPDLAVEYGDDWAMKLVSFDCTADGRVGVPVPADSPKSISYFDVTCDFLLADPGTWAQSDGRPLVLATKHAAPGSGEALDPVPIWVERDVLVDPSHARTLNTIDEVAAVEEAELSEDFWPKLKAKIEATTKIHVPDDTQGVAAGSEKIVAVPKGTYEKVGVRDGTFLLPDSAPFFVIIKVPQMGVVAITYASVEGAETAQSVEAQAEGLAASVPAATIVETFAEGPAPIRDYLPAQAWLTDAQIHYVTPDEMGAAHVLERMPTSLQELVEAKAKDNNAFVQGMSVPGLRLEEHILIQLTVRGTGTEYHEALHLLSHRNFRKTFGFWFNEGVTEYFTRMVIAQPATRRELVRTDSPYEAPLTAARTLVEKHIVTDIELSKAYFVGNLGPLYSGFHVATGGALSLLAFAERLDPPHAHIACDLLERVVAEHAATAT
jgi:hypothetical protein